MPTKTKPAATKATEAVTEDPQLTEDLFDESGEPEAQDADYSEPEAQDADYSEASAPGRPVRISGPELLAFYAERKAAGRTHNEIAYDAGYFTVTRGNLERVMAAQFNQAMLEAQGIETGSGSAGPGRSHAGLTRARVSGQGIMLVSQLATRHVGAEPGHMFDVSYPGGGAILLSPTGEVKPVVPRKKGHDEQPGAPLLDLLA